MSGIAPDYFGEIFLLGGGALGVVITNGVAVAVLNFLEEPGDFGAVIRVAGTVVNQAGRVGSAVGFFESALAFDGKGSGAAGGGAMRDDPGKGIDLGAVFRTGGAIGSGDADEALSVEGEAVMGVEVDPIDAPVLFEIGGYAGDGAESVEGEANPEEAFVTGTVILQGELGSKPRHPGGEAERNRINCGAGIGNGDLSRKGTDEGFGTNCGGAEQKKGQEAANDGSWHCFHGLRLRIGLGLEFGFGFDLGGLMASAADIAKGFNGLAIHDGIGFSEGCGAEGFSGTDGTPKGGTEGCGIHLRPGSRERLRCLRRGRGRRSQRGRWRRHQWFRENCLGFMEGLL